MHNYSLRQFGRTILTITGILLLVIFGGRAASQATSLSAVGGQTKHTVYPIALTASQLVAIAETGTRYSLANSYTVISPGANEAKESKPSKDNLKIANMSGRAKQAVAQLANEAESKVSDVELKLNNNKPFQADVN